MTLTLDTFNTFNTIGIVGAGTMGAGIAQVAAQAGCRVKLYDAREGAARTALASASDLLAKLVEKGKLSAADATRAAAHMSAATDLADFHDCDLIVEAIIEDVHAKQALFKSLETICAPTVVLASNTSSISITAIANGLARPENVVGMHFFNPVPIMKLVEVVRTILTDENIYEQAIEFGKQLGKVPVRANDTNTTVRTISPRLGPTTTLLASAGRMTRSS